MKRFGVLLLPALFFIGCGGNSGDGPPRPLSFEEDAEIVPSVIGNCKKLCCASSDCPAGTACQPFDAPLGTLGTCSGEPAAAWGSVSPGATLPDGCWDLDEPQCHPLTNAGCESGEACDFDPGDDQLDPVVMCFSGVDSLKPGDVCDAVYGPACEIGYHCAPDA